MQWSWGENHKSILTKVSPLNIIHYIDCKCNVAKDERELVSGGFDLQGLLHTEVQAFPFLHALSIGETEMVSDFKVKVLYFIVPKS